MISINIDALKTFNILAKCGSFTKTAQILYMSQSAVSDRIRELESQLGQQLFYRDKRSVLLTPAGTALLPYANKITSLELEAITEVNLTSRYSDTIHIGFTHSLFDGFGLEILQEFIDSHPDISVKLSIAHSEEIIPQLENYDIAFTYEAVHFSSYTCQPFIVDQVVFVTSSKNQAYKSGITYETLAEMPLINTRLSDNDTWPFPGPRLYAIDINITSVARPLLLSGKWSGFTLKRMISDDLKNGQLIEVPVLDLELPQKQSYIIFKNTGKKNCIDEFLKVADNYLNQT